MARTKKRPCATCGKPFAAPLGGRGRPRIHCEACERPRGSQSAVARKETATRSRKLQKQRRGAQAQARAAAPADAALHWAAATRILGAAAEHSRIAELAGLAGLPTPELVQIARSAGELHGDIGRGELDGLARRLHAAQAILANQLVRSSALIQPGQIAHGLSALTKALALLGEIRALEQSQDAPDPGELELLDEDGRRLRLIDGELTEPEPEEKKAGP